LLALVVGFNEADLVVHRCGHFAANLPMPIAAGVRELRRQTDGRRLMEATSMRKHWFPKASPEKQPSPWWYFGRAVYVSRRDYWRIFRVFVSVGIPLGVVGLLTGVLPLFWAAFGLAILGLLLLAYSLIGLYRMYGHPARQYVRRLLEMGDVQGTVVVADLHIGTYRHAYALANQLPEATIYTIDCWNVEGAPAEEAIRDVRDLEPPPTHNPRIRPLQSDEFALPLPIASCDVVVLGFGTHEIPRDGPLQKVFQEARRILKPGGKVLMFEHGYDFHNYLIFGPVIHHVTTRQEWQAVLQEHFADVQYGRTSHAVDLFMGTRRA
jgi:SAM-dependent methyltransferase